EQSLFQNVYPPVPLADFLDLPDSKHTAYTSFPVYVDLYFSMPCTFEWPPHTLWSPCHIGLVNNDNIPFQSMHPYGQGYFLTLNWAAYRVLPVNTGNLHHPYPNLRRFDLCLLNYLFSTGVQIHLYTPRTVSNMPVHFPVHSMSYIACRS